MNSAIITSQEDAGGAGDKCERVLIHMYDVAAAVTARGVVPKRISVGPKPDIESAKEDAVGIVRIDGDGLVVPILRVIAGAAGAVEQGSSGRTGNLAPSHTSIRRAIRAVLATRGAAAAAVGVRDNRLHLRVEVVRITRCDREFDPSHLVPRACADIGGPAGGVRSGPAVGVGGDRGKVAWATAARDGCLVDAVRSVLIQVVLHGRGETAHAHRGDDARAGAGVRESETGDVLPHGAEAVGRAGSGPIRAAVIRKIETSLRPGDDVVTVPRIHAHFAHGLILRELTGRQRERGAENICAQQRPVGAAVGRFQDALAPHGEGTEIQIARASVDRVVIVRIDRDRIDRDRGEQRIIGGRRPGRAAIAAVGRFPNAAVHGPDVSDVGRDRINRDVVHAARGEAVIEAARAAGHAQGFRPERGEVIGIKHERALCFLEAGHLQAEWDAALDQGVLPSGPAHPFRIEDAGGISHPRVPFAFHAVEIIRLFAGDRQVTLRLFLGDRLAIGTGRASAARRETGHCEREATQAKREREQESGMGEGGLRKGNLSPVGILHGADGAPPSRALTSF